MVPDLAFLHKKHADRYIDEQPGVFDRPGPWSTQKFGDWQVRPIEVLDYDIIEASEQREKLKMRALAKLTDEEMEVLGLCDG